MQRVFPLLLALALLVPAAAPADGTNEEAVLRSIAEIDAFTADATPRKAPFKLTGTVVGTFLLPKTGEVVLSDDSGTRMSFYRDLGLSRPEPGDTIEASGVANMSGEHEPYVLLEDYRVLGRGPRPEPVAVRLPELNAREHNLAVVRTEGTVADAFPDEVDRRYTILLLEDGGAVVPVSFPRDAFGDRRDLVDARIRVTGVYRRNVEGVRKYSWPNIAPSAPEDIEVLEPPPADPFSAPPLENRLYLTSGEIARMSRRSVSGEVLATWSGDRAMLRTGDGRIVNLTLAHEFPLIDGKGEDDDPILAFTGRPPRRGRRRRTRRRRTPRPRSGTTRGCTPSTRRSTERSCARAASSGPCRPPATRTCASCSTPATRRSPWT